MMRFTVHQLAERARERLPGYVTAVLASAVRTGDTLDLTPEEHTRIREAYTLPAPTLAALATNFLGAMATWALAGFPTVDEATYRARLATCTACEDYDAARGKCRRCGCKKSKLWLATETCPALRWAQAPA